MAASNKEFRTIVGVVGFPPKEGNAGGKTVRNISVRQTGVHAKEAVRISATLWPSFDHIDVQEGDVVLLDGSYTENKGTNQAGESVTYYNLSVSKLAVLGRADAGTKPERDDEPTADDVADDDIPF